MSRFLPSTSDEDSNLPVRHNSHDTDTDHTDDMAIDEENLGGHFENQDLDALLAEAAGSEISEKSMATRPVDRGSARGPTSGPSRITPKWMQNNSRARAARQEDDDEVPASLMLEEHKETSPMLARNQRRALGEAPYELPQPVPGPSTNHTRAQWETTRRQQQLHDRRPVPSISAGRPGRGAARLSITADPKERALRKWAQVENLDSFLTQVYSYYERKGIWSILLGQSIMLL
jgi:autophagy-related protein 9